MSSSTSTSSSSSGSGKSSSGHDSSSSMDLPDSAVKLGSLLVDMDELDEAHQVFEGLSSHHTHKNHHHSHSSSNNNQHSAAQAVLLLHRAELLVNKNDFQGAVALLRQAQKLVQSPLDDPWSASSNRTVLKQVELNP